MKLPPSDSVTRVTETRGEVSSTRTGSAPLPSGIVRGLVVLVGWDRGHSAPSVSQSQPGKAEARMQHINRVVAIGTRADILVVVAFARGENKKEDTRARRGNKYLWR